MLYLDFAKLKIFYRSLFNLANAFLVIIIILTGWRVSLFLDSKKQVWQNQNTKLELRIVNSEKNNFNQLDYIGLLDGYFWKIDTKDYYEVGKKYTVEGEISTFDFQKNSKDKFYNYNLSLNLNGQIKVKKTLSKTTFCDLLCQILQTKATLVRYTDNSFYKASCQEFLVVAKFLNINCRDIFGLSLGLVLGGSGSFSPDFKTNFRSLGLSHLVAVSGFQVVLLANLVEFLLIKLNLNRKFRFFLILLSLAGMLILIGAQPPIVRSILSLLISNSVLLFLGRRVDSLRNLIYSAVIMLWLVPAYAISLSFQLSFLASFGLVMGVGMDTLDFSKFNLDTTKLNSVFISFWQKLFNTLKVLFLTTFYSTLFTLPLVINLSGKLSLFGILANVLIVPIIPVVTILNLFGLLPIIGGLFLFLANFIQAFLIVFINTLAPLSPIWSISNFSYLEILIYVLVLSLLIKLSKFTCQKQF